MKKEVTPRNIAMKFKNINNKENSQSIYKQKIDEVKRKKNQKLALNPMDLFYKCQCKC